MPPDDTKTIPIAVRVKGDAISASGPEPTCRDVLHESVIGSWTDVTQTS